MSGTRRSVCGLAAAVLLVTGGCHDAPVQAPPGGRMHLSSHHVLGGDSVILIGQGVSALYQLGDAGVTSDDTLSLSFGPYRISEFYRVGIDSVGFVVSDTTATGTYPLIVRKGGEVLLLENDALHVSGFTSYLERTEDFLLSALREFNNRAIGFDRGGEVVLIDPETLLETGLGIVSCGSVFSLGVGLSFRPGGFLVGNNGCRPTAVTYQVLAGKITEVDSIPNCGWSAPRHLVEVAPGVCVIREKRGLLFEGEFLRYLSTQSWLMKLSPNNRWVVPTSSWTFFERAWPLVKSVPGEGRFLFPFPEAGRLNAAEFTADGDTLYYASSSDHHPDYLDVLSLNEMKLLRRRELALAPLALIVDPLDAQTLLMISEELVDSAISAQDGNRIRWDFSSRKVLELIDVSTLETVKRVATPVAPMLPPSSRWTSATPIRARNRAVYFIEPWGNQRWRFDIER